MPETTLRPWIKACVTREFHAISNGCWRLEWASKKIKQNKQENSMQYPMVAGDWSGLPKKQNK